MGFVTDLMVSGCYFPLPLPKWDNASIFSPIGLVCWV